MGLPTSGRTLRLVELQEHPIHVGFIHHLPLGTGIEQVFLGVAVAQPGQPPGDARYGA